MGGKKKIYCILEEEEVSTENCLDCPPEMFPCLEFAQKFNTKFEDEVPEDRLDDSITRFFKKLK